jgi:hypothetical protein
MKPFSLLKLPAMLLGLGAVMVLTPTCRAQSEISPDHFDGTDPWESALAQRNSGANHKQVKTPGALQAKQRKPDSGPAVTLAAAREVSNPAHQDAVAIQDKRKAASRKPNKQ